MYKNNIIRYSIFTGLWAVLLIPFYVANSMFFPYITGKNFAFRIIVEIIFALWIYLAYVNEKYRPKFSWILGSVGLFVLIMAVADFFAVAPVKAFFSNFERMDGWITLIHLLMYLLVFGSVMKTEKVWLWFFRSSLITSILMIISVISEWQKTGAERVSVTLGNPIYVAVYFLFNFFFALILLYKDVIEKKSHDLKEIFKSYLSYAYIIAAFICLFGIWRTGTRGVILGLLGGLIISSLFIAIFEKKNKLMRKLSVTVLVIIVALVVGFLGIKDTQFVKNSSTLQRLAEISWSNVAGQGQARQYVWPMAIKGFQEKPILGWGQDGFNYVFNKYYDPRMYNQEQWFDRAHDMPLDILVAGGILGLVSYLLIFLSAAYLIWKKRNILGVTDAGLLLGLLAGYFAQNLFVFDNLTSYVLFFVVLSYLHSRDTENMADVAVKNQKNLGKINPDIANYIIAPIVIVIFGLGIWYLNIRPINGNLALIKAMQGYQEGPTKNLEYFKSAISNGPLGTPEVREQILNIALRVTSMNIDAKVKQDFVDFAYSQIQEQIKQTPNDARYQLFAGAFLDNINQYQLALPYLQKAVELSPNKQTMMFELAKCLMYLGQNQKALEVAKRAYDLIPEFNEAKSTYIAALLVNNNEALAKQLMGNATTTSSEIIVRAYLIRASVYLQKGDKNSAIAEIQKAMAIVPGFRDQGQKIIEAIQSGKVIN
jgi:O-antigen ligase